MHSKQTLKCYVLRVVKKPQAHFTLQNVQTGQLQHFSSWQSLLDYLKDQDVRLKHLGEAD